MHVQDSQYTMPAEPGRHAASARIAETAATAARARKTLFGQHIMLDLRFCSQQRLGDLERCFAILDTLPTKIGMKKLAPPYVFHYKATAPNESGITGVTIIAESHITLHTFPHKGYAFADVFSCKPFHSAPVVTLFKEALDCKECHVFTQERGRHFVSS